MSIDKDDLVGGLKLVGSYKKTDHTLDVKDTDDGLRFILDGNKKEPFKSLSAAASAVMNGSAANGWRFWSIEGAAPVKAEPKAKSTTTTKAPTGTAKKTTKKKSTPERETNIIFARVQKGSPDGQKRLFCYSCAKSFFAPEADGLVPCPEGHQVKVANDDFSGTPAELEAEPETASADEVEDIFAEPATA